MASGSEARLPVCGVLGSGVIFPGNPTHDTEQYQVPQLSHETEQPGCPTIGVQHLSA